MDEFQDLLFEEIGVDLKKQAEARSVDEQLLRSYRVLSETPHGRDVIWDLISFCHLFDCTFTGNSRTFFLEGQRSVGLYLLWMLQVSDSEDVLSKIKSMKRTSKEDADGGK
jgi:hypothetical protein